jgi:hypothetical protein
MELHQEKDETTQGASTQDADGFPWDEEQDYSLGHD